MKQINKIIIHNFQCHKKTIIEPAPTGLTVVTGPTDYGKSAVVRALRWLFYNRPQGGGFIRHGASECVVRVELNDKTTVARRRTKSLNQYYINDELYEGFGNKVPLEVQRTLGVYSYDVADETLKLNIAEQLSGPFLGSSITAPTRAKILGKLAGTEAIDRANKDLGTDVYRSKQSKKKLEKEIKEKVAEINEYSWVEPLGEILNQVEDKMDEINQNQERISKLKDLKERINQNEAKKSKLYNNLNHLITLDHIIAQLNTIGDKVKRKEELKQLSNRLVQIEDKKIYLTNQMIWFAGLEKSKSKINQLTTNCQTKNILANKQEKLLTLFQQQQWLEESYDQLKNVSNAADKIDNIKNRTEKVSNMSYTLQNLVRNRKKKSRFKDRLNKVKDVPRAWESIDELESLHDKNEKQHQLLVNYNATQQTIDEIRDKKENYKQMKLQAIKEVKSSKEKYHNLLDKIGICPTCGAKNDDQDLEKVI